MRKLVEGLVSVLFKIMGCFQNEKLVYFESFHGKQYSDNPKAIYQFIEKQYPDYKLVWGVTKGYEAPFRVQNIPFVTRFSIKWFFVMPRAKAWVINTRTPLWLHKPKNTRYIQTWHGTPLKKIGCDIPEVKIPGYTSESYRESFRKESARWNYLISPNTYSTKIFGQAFQYNGIIKEYGYPRNDKLTLEKDNFELKQQIKEKLGIPLDKKLVLYAPTWRETDQRVGGLYQFGTPFPFEKIAQTFGDEIVLLTRMHYLVAQQFDFSNWPDRVVDVSTGIDMSDLLLISDLLITDYSSCMFDFAITNQPILYYIPDVADYEEELRGFYFDLDATLPGPMIQSEEEIMHYLEIFLTNPDTLKTKHYQQFKDKFTALEDGEATKRIVAQIVQN